jgi:membrane protease YdiL (CAAX protease family)
MLGIIVELIISWLMIWFFERRNLSVLGFRPSEERLKDLVFGLIASSIISAIYYLSIGYISGGKWTFDETYSMQSFFPGAWWTLKSVLFEELIFRGALLYIAIRKLGLTIGCVVSAICFGTYHWFSYDVFGDAVRMLFIFLVTGIAGLMFAFAFGVTRSLYLPIALHYGYNFTSYVVFSNGPLGNQLFILQNGSQTSGVLSTAASVFQLLALPLIVLWYLKRLRKLPKPV